MNTYMKPLESLKRQYKETERIKNNNPNNQMLVTATINFYRGMRTLCLDCNLVSFKDIEVMEYEVEQELKD